ncbi:MAG: cation-translocating P-type ATPase [Planctomycetota bacterium]
MDDRAETSSTQRVRLKIDGMHCAGCVASIERALHGVQGVESVAVDLLGGAASIAGERLHGESLIKAVASRGFEARQDTSRASLKRARTELEDTQRANSDRWRRRFLIALSGWIPLAFIHWAGPTVGIAHESIRSPASVWLWVVLAISTAVQIAAGSGFYASAWRALRARSANMDTLIALGSTAAYTLSVVTLALEASDLPVRAPLYFGEAAGLLTLVSLGHWLEARTTASASSSVRELLAMQPDTVTRLEHDSASNGEVVDPAEIKPGDLMLVRAGERVAVDGEIVRGESVFDESVVTGESRPVERGVGGNAIAGAVNAGSSVVVRATTDGVHTTLARIAEMVRDAQSSKTNIQRVADRVSGLFVPAVLVISLGTLVAWLIVGHEAGAVGAVVNAMTVLIISCPCALGLATPVAVMAATGAASRKGILLRSGAALERLSRVRTVFFDKTGTLTRGEPTLVNADDVREALPIAAALAMHSTHPLSRAIVTAAGADHAHADEAHETRGVGVEGLVRGERAALLSPKAARVRGLSVEDDDARTSVVLTRADREPAVLLFEDAVREDAESALALLATRGFEVGVLTGDGPGPSRVLAERLGLDDSVIKHSMTPESKRAHIDSAAERGVLMVGDGINDAPAMAHTTARGGVSAAINTGADVSIEAADVVVPGSDLSSVPRLLRIGSRSMTVIKQNLVFAFVYNVLAIPAAALGLLGMHGPLIGAAAMALSDLCVVGNALRLKRELERS